jgi:hypothetical protein
MRGRSDPRRFVAVNVALEISGIQSSKQVFRYNKRTIDFQETKILSKEAGLPVPL